MLINGGTFSTASEFASIAHANNRALFIGEETGGGYYGNCSLGTPTLWLPNSSIGVTIPLAKYELAVTNNVSPGRGLIPEIQTHYSIEDILTNNDKDINVCIKLIRDGLR